MKTLLICKICDEVVNPDRLRDHLGEHNPNAYNMDWEDVRNMYRLKSVEEK